jgi:hypothetical protein
VSRAALVDLAIMLGVFALASAVAGIAGAANLGTALSFGQIGFGLAAFYVLVRR